MRRSRHARNPGPGGHSRALCGAIWRHRRRPRMAVPRADPRPSDYNVNHDPVAPCDRTGTGARAQYRHGPTCDAAAPGHSGPADRHYRGKGCCMARGDIGKSGTQSRGPASELKENRSHRDHFCFFDFCLYGCPRWTRTHDSRQSISSYRSAGKAPHPSMTHVHGNRTGYGSLIWRSVLVRAEKPRAGSGPDETRRGILAARAATSRGQQESAQGLSCSRRRFRSAAILFFALLRTLLAGMGRPLPCGLRA
jgi:hypothetical protein